MVNPDLTLAKQRADNQAYHAQYDPLLKIFQLSTQGYLNQKQKIAADVSLAPAAKAAQRQQLLSEAIGQIGDMLEEGGWRKTFKSEAARNSPDAAYAMGHFFTTYMETGCFNRAIDFYNEFADGNKAFAQDAGVMANLAIAYNDKRTIDPDRSPAAPPAPDVSRAKDVIGQALKVIDQKDFPTGLAAQYHAKLEAVVARSMLLDTSIPQSKRDEGARQAYKSAFNEAGGFSHYPAYNAMLLGLKAGDRKDAETWAGLTYMATMRDGGIFSTDPLVISRTMVAILVNPEMAQTPSGKTVNTPENALAQFEKINIEDWQKQAIAHDVSGVMDALRQRGDDASRARADLIRDRVLPALTGEKPARFTPIQNPDGDEKTQRLSESSYTFNITMGVPGLNAGAGTIIPGNLNVGGIIPDIVLSNHDLAAFSKLSRIKLGDVLDRLGERSQSASYERIANSSLSDLAKNMRVGREASPDYREGLRLVTRAFALMKTRNMENMSSKGDHGHESFDEAIKGSRELGGAPEGKFNNFSSPTSLARLIEERLLDCRITNKLAPVLAKVAAGEAINDLIADTVRAVGKNPSDAQTHLNGANAEMRNIRSQQLETADLSLMARVEVDANGKPKMVGGYYVPNKAPDAPFVEIEPHSVDLQPTRAADGTIANFITADTFYNGEVRDQSGKALPGATYNLNGIAITENMLEKLPSGMLAIDFGTGTGLRGAPANGEALGPLIEVRAETKSYMLDRTRKASTAFQPFMLATMGLSYGRPVKIEDAFDHLGAHSIEQAQARARQLGEFHHANIATLQPTNNAAIAAAKPVVETVPVVRGKPQFENLASTLAQVNVASNAVGQRMAAQALADEVAQLDHARDLTVARAGPGANGIVQQPPAATPGLYAQKAQQAAAPQITVPSMMPFLKEMQGKGWVNKVAADHVARHDDAAAMATKWAENSIAELKRTIDKAMIAGNYRAPPQSQPHHAPPHLSAPARLHMQHQNRK